MEHELYVQHITNMLQRMQQGREEYLNQQNFSPEEKNSLRFNATADFFACLFMAWPEEKFRTELVKLLPDLHERHAWIRQKIHEGLVWINWKFYNVLETSTPSGKFLFNVNKKLWTMLNKSMMWTGNMQVWYAKRYGFIPWIH